MPFRQIAVVLIALIVIVAAALFVTSWGDDGDDRAEPDQSTTTSSSSTSTTTSTLPPAPTTSIPVACEAEAPAETEEPSTSSTTSTTSTTLAEGEEPDEPEEPLVPTLGPNSSVSTVGLDTVAFGLTVSQAETAAGTRMIPCEPVSDCYRVSPAEAPEGISFLVHEGTIERVDIVAGPITTSSGAGIGTTGERLVELFGERIERQVLGTDTVDFVFVPTDENDAQFRVAFTVVDGVVETFRSGRIPMVLDADPCGVA